MKDILQVDISGTPQGWISVRTAACMICSDNIGWTSGPVVRTLRGGRSRATGLQSTLDIPAIIASNGQSKVNLASFSPVLGRHNYKLFERDRYLCAYCGEIFERHNLTREHVIPTSKGGMDVWTNVVTACGYCNRKKSNRTPEQAGMPLLYTPYTPNWFEDFLLQKSGREILSDQMDFLLRRVPEHSRLRPENCLIYQ